MITELRTEIDRMLVLAPGLSDNQVYMGIAPQAANKSESQGILAVWNLITNTNFEDTGHRYEESFVQINISGSNHNEIEVIQHQVDDIFLDEAEYRLLEHTMLLVSRDFVTQTVIEDRWQIIIQYKIVIYKQIGA